MMNELDAISVEYDKLKESERYRFIARFKRYLNTRPELKEHTSHELFKKMISWHIACMISERDALQNFLNKSYDALTDGLSYQPHRYLEGSAYLLEKVSERIVELDGFISEYQAELIERKELK